MQHTPSIPADRRAAAERHVWQFTAAAAATGAIPVPGASAAIARAAAPLRPVCDSVRSERCTGGC